MNWFLKKALRAMREASVEDQLRSLRARLDNHRIHVEFGGPPLSVDPRDGVRIRKRMKELQHILRHLRGK
jgi:hypothetical protein